MQMGDTTKVEVTITHKKKRKERKEKKKTTWKNLLESCSMHHGLNEFPLFPC